MTVTAGSLPTAALRGARRAAVVVVVIALVAAAAVGIATLLIGEFGLAQQRTLTTTLVVAAFGATMLCHFAIAGRPVRAVGFVGIAVSAAALAGALVTIWAELPEQISTPWQRTLWVLTVAALSLAQVNLLLLLAAQHRLVLRIGLPVTVAAVVAVGVLISLTIASGGDIPGSNGDAYWRAVGIIAIIDGLGTIALPVVRAILRDRPAGTVRIPVDLPAELADAVRAESQGSGRTVDAVIAEALESALGRGRGA
ncbi:hypothetical protein BH11ACT4_BH11ACT4_11910 [soil metagenome]